MIPTELKGGSLRVVDPGNEDERNTSMDLSKETRLQAVTNLTKYQDQTKAWYEPKIKVNNLKPGHLVLRSVIALGKLGNKWEGPYIILRSGRPGSFKLANLEAKELNHAWHAEHLQHYYA
ncbi:hypothetical protein GUJ93_ZPchr0012g21319 [Zizania palustris]|uniref:Uncharacterized protein n=1 Tax=Zizania palustris TaxID=103762 RepID=A0A8J5WV98_ZIZPA|nr:hypothetical protein GUJ93_ZPchr0012g21319 [Zizania palustris]